ncbi:MAG: hypothetical protein IKG14_03535 [Clostridia bacterium]|nr:hypothetical protein [Clostridia bacterium]
MSKRTLKIIKIAIVIFVIVTLIGSLIVLQDTHHLETCYEQHCIYCRLIHIAQNIINIVFALVVILKLGFLIYFFLSRIEKEIVAFVHLSLVFQKVQFNE